MIRFLPLVLALTLALGACNPGSRHVEVQSPRYASLDATLDRGGAVQERRPTPVAMLPSWIGRPTRVREREDAESFEQVISLSLAPRGDKRENLVMVAMPRSRDAADRLLDGTARFMGKPTESGIRAELETAFPGVPMQVVTRPASNAYGPYGLAIGRGAHGARCLYAWQWLEDAPALVASRNGGPLSIRVRLCRSDITLEAMAASVNQLKLVPRFQGGAVETAHAQPEPRRRRSHPVRVASAVSRDETVQPVRAIPRTALIAEEPAPNGRRYLGAESVPAQSPASTYAPVSSGTARSTLAGLGGPAPSAAQNITPTSIAADLPPEAYRGPASGQTR